MEINKNEHERIVTENKKLTLLILIMIQIRLVLIQPCFSSGLDLIKRLVSPGFILILSYDLVPFVDMVWSWVLSWLRSKKKSQIIPDCVPIQYWFRPVSDQVFILGLVLVQS